MSEIGHNGHLKAFIERIERVEAERKDLGDDLKEIYKEAVSSGYDAKILRKVIALRRQDAAKLAEQEALIETYLAAIGDLKDTPLGQAAISKIA